MAIVDPEHQRAVILSVLSEQSPRSEQASIASGEKIILNCARRHRLGQRIVFEGKQQPVALLDRLLPGIPTIQSAPFHIDPVFGQFFLNTGWTAESGGIVLIVSGGIGRGSLGPDGQDACWE